MFSPNFLPKWIPLESKNDHVCPLAFCWTRVWVHARCFVYCMGRLTFKDALEVCRRSSWNSAGVIFEHWPLSDSWLGNVVPHQVKPHLVGTAVILTRRTSIGRWGWEHSKHLQWLKVLLLCCFSFRGTAVAFIFSVS